MQGAPAASRSRCCGSAAGLVSLAEDLERVEVRWTVLSKVARLLLAAIAVTMVRKGLAGLIQYYHG